MSFTSELQARTEPDSKEMGIQRAVDNASDAWKALVLEFIRQICLFKAVFSVDYVIRDMENFGIETRSLRAMSGLLKQAVSKGWCKIKVCPCCNSPITKESLRKSNHSRRVMQYESCILQNNGNPC